MTHYNTLANEMKRRVITFCKKFSQGLSRPDLKFVADMIFGLLAAKSCLLTNIARACREPISLKKTIDRLSRHLSQFDGGERLLENCHQSAPSALGKDSMLIIDSGDITKPAGKKFEAIGSVRDGSTGRFGNGYWTYSVLLLTGQKHNPAPVYENVSPCKEKGGEGPKIENARIRQYLRENFPSELPRVYDRGYDSGEVFRDHAEHGEAFIIRQSQNRVVTFGGQQTKIESVVRGLVCETGMSFQSRTGDKSICRIGAAEIILPNVKQLRLKLVVCKEWGKSLLVLYTNINEPLETLGLRVVKAYLTRWRIEEIFRLKKQGFGLEKFQVRSLNAIKNLNLLVAISICFLWQCADKLDSEAYAVALILASKRVPKLDKYRKKTKFLYYAILDGLAFVFSFLRSGVRGCFAQRPKGVPLSLPSA